MVVLVLVMVMEAGGGDDYICLVVYAQQRLRGDPLKNYVPEPTLSSKIRIMIHFRKGQFLGKGRHKL